MTLTFDTLPVVPPNALRRRSRPEPLGRRAFLGRAAATAGALGVAYMTLWDTGRAHAADDGKYYREWTNTTTGPCAPGNYADREDAKGRKCGPSYSHPRYCWTGATTVSGEALANTGNKRGWHRWEYFSDSEYYSQRPDDCWRNNGGSDYDSWRWTFSQDGVTYGCSDGRVCNQNYCYLNTICPYQR